MQHTNLWTRIRSMFLGVERLGATGTASFRPQVKRTSLARSGHGRRPRILLLTSELGHGHARAATAIRLAIRRTAPHAVVRILDWWSLMNPDVSRAAKQMYLTLVQAHSDLYERIYSLEEHTWRELLLAKSVPPPPVLQLIDLIHDLHLADSWGPVRGPYASDRTLFSLFCVTRADSQPWMAGGLLAKLALLKWSWARLARRLRVRLEHFAPDVVVSTQMIPAALVASIKSSSAKWMSLPSVAVPTDFGVHDFWNQPGTDVYCLGHDCLSALPRNFDDRRAVITGFPLMPEFARPLPMAEARQQLGLRVDMPTVLVLGGGLGLGVETLTEQLTRLSTAVQILVLCGRNAQALEVVQAIAARDVRVRVFDWTERVDVFMSAADLVVGKSGGLTVAEVLACGRPLLVTRSLRGQEGFNVRFLERHGVGALLSDEELLARIAHLLAHPTELAELKARAHRLGRGDGATEIARCVLRLATHHDATLDLQGEWLMRRLH